MVSIVTDRLTKVFDGVTAVDGLTIEVASGEFVALLGPTGCGKSTILRLLAGLDAPTSGHVLLDGRLADGLTARERNVAMVFQDFALYPHLTAAENIAFPLRSRSAAEQTSQVAEVAAELGITDLLHRRPGTLSGGQRQRVATARAVVRRPGAFLLDEPMSNVDAALRAELRTEMAALARRRGVTTIYVTHDQVEAMTMADRIGLLRRGVLHQLGTPAEVYGDPRTLFAAAFVGTPRARLVQGAIYADGDVVIDVGSQVLRLPPTGPVTAGLARRHTQRVTLALRPEALTPVPYDDAGPMVLRGSVRTVQHLGHEILAHLETGAVPTSVAESGLELPDTGYHLADLAAEGVAGPANRSAGPARTEYGFYPVYEAVGSGEPAPGGDLLVRLPPIGSPRRGDRMAVRVDVERLLIFDGRGDRIRLDPEPPA